ncbi:hypothetical protein [Streptomyces coerulescens]|uniref:Uncharacterized protein n=1 Tax=Streptomyces coerulescens TaxID=29304 RepID=A0ABW0CVX2_STRCD
MTTRFDEDDVDGPQFAPDDPLAVILRPPADHLAPPPGHYETLRRKATRRRLVRTATGVGVTCALALLVALPFTTSGPDVPTNPTPPLAPPPTSDRTTPPTPSPSTPAPSASPTRTPPSGRTASPTPTPRPGTPTSVPTRDPQAVGSRTPDATVTPTARPSVEPTRGAGDGATPSAG